jgi:hypothetical protein
LKLMQPYFIQMVKIQSLPAEVTAFFSKYWETTEGEEVHVKNCSRKKVESVEIKYAETECNSVVQLPSYNMHE